MPDEQPVIRIDRGNSAVACGKELCRYPAQQSTINDPDMRPARCVGFQNLGLRALRQLDHHGVISARPFADIDQFRNDLAQVQHRGQGDLGFNGGFGHCGDDRINNGRVSRGDNRGNQRLCQGVLCRGFLHLGQRGKFDRIGAGHGFNRVRRRDPFFGHKACTTGHFVKCHGQKEKCHQNKARHRSRPQQIRPTRFLAIYYTGFAVTGQ